VRHFNLVTIDLANLWWMAVGEAIDVQDIEQLELAACRWFDQLAVGWVIRDDSKQPKLMLYVDGGDGWIGDGSGANLPMFM
jgi:hypothetical protein